MLDQLIAMNASGAGIFWKIEELKPYAMKTAIKASKKIRAPPTMGSTMGIMGTIASITSAGCCLSCGVADMLKNTFANLGKLYCS